MLSAIGTMLDLGLVILGFTGIIFIHELGHFIAARWAGIRVLSFAIGMGPAVASYRRGMGWRRGSSEAEYRRVLAADQDATTRRDTGAISPTEYRLNALPIGGYVKMLGQEDLDPGAVSTEPDSYQMTPPWKRMVVISAGVVMNLISAAALFILVFMVGLKTEPPTIGRAGPGSAAAKAVALNADALGITTPGLLSGDRLLWINGQRPNSFNDLSLAAAMARPGKPIHLIVERPGVRGTLQFDVVPEKSQATGLLELGVEPSRSIRVFEARHDDDAAVIAQRAESLGIPGLRPGMALADADGEPITALHTLEERIRSGDGRPMSLGFTDEKGRASGTIVPEPELQLGLVQANPTTLVPVEHVLGLTPVLRVGQATDRGRTQGLRDGDVFARVGSVEFPSVSQGIAEIRRHRGREIDLVLLRDEADGPTEVSLRALVDSRGTIGFAPDDTARTDSLLAIPPARLADARRNLPPEPPAAHGLISLPGTRLEAINGHAVSNLLEAREVLRSALDGRAGTVRLTLSPPTAHVLKAPGPSREVAWEIAESDSRALSELGWTSPIVDLFAGEEFTLRASDPGEAIGMGLRETRRVMLMTYATFARLFEGTVKIEHLKGPVGIAHLGTIIADRGLVWLVFFLALISVNLAVINFLPMPIVDGGQLLFLIVEQLRGKPAPIAIQNAATLAGLVLIGAVFLVTTFNDIGNLLGF